jgi:hypothetical protein
MVDLHATVIQGTPFTVKVLSDDTPGQVLLQAPSLSVQVASIGKSKFTVTLGPPLSATRTDLNGDGTADLVLQFAGRDLQGLVAGPAQVTVRGTRSDGTSGFSFRTFTLTGTARGGAVNAGHTPKPRHHHKHHRATHTSASPAGARTALSTTAGLSRR